MGFLNKTGVIGKNYPSLSKKALFGKICAKLRYLTELSATLLVIRLEQCRNSLTRYMSLPLYISSREKLLRDGLARFLDPVETKSSDHFETLNGF